VLLMVLDYEFKRNILITRYTISWLKPRVGFRGSNDLLTTTNNYFNLFTLLIFPFLIILFLFTKINSRGQWHKIRSNIIP